MELLDDSFYLTPPSTERWCGLCGGYHGKGECDDPDATEDYSLSDEP